MVFFVLFFFFFFDFFDFLFSNLSTYITLELEHIVASYLGASSPTPVESVELLCFDPLVGCVCVYVCVFFFPCKHLCIFLELLLHKSPFFVLFCFVLLFLLGKFYQVNFGPRTFATMPDGTKGTYTFIDVLLAIILPPLGVFFKYGFEVCTYVCLVVVVVVFLLLHHHQLLELQSFIESLVSFGFFLSFNIWSMVDMIVSCQRICLLIDLHGGLILSCGLLRNLQVICQRRGGNCCSRIL